MASTNVRRMPGEKVTYKTRDEGMRVYDLLPLELRDGLKYADGNYDPVQLRRLMRRGHSVTSLIDLLARNDRKRHESSLRDAFR